MVDYFGGSARKISKNQLDVECKRKRKEQRQVVVASN